MEAVVEERGPALITLNTARLQNSSSPRISWSRSKSETGTEGSRKSMKATCLSLAHTHRLRAVRTRTDGPRLMENTVLEGAKEPEPAT